MKRSYPDRPIVGVGALVFRGEEVLLVKRGKPPREGQWSIPGGMQQLGESVAEAACREVREEAGIEIEVKETIAVVDSISRDEGGRVQYHYTLVDLLAEWQAGEAKAGDDAAEVAWVALDRLAPYRLWRETERVIALAAQRRKAAPGSAPAIHLVR
jgi:8-oxo-dGTP diphosphatase